MHRYASGFRSTIINESAARMLFPVGRAMGREFRRDSRDAQPWTVLGVIADFIAGHWETTGSVTVSSRLGAGPCC